MPKNEVALLHLKNYIPEGSFDDVVHYLQQYKVHLTISRQRQSVLGDYRHKHADKAHRISVNSNLNKYSFLITLLHELAHLLTYERFGHRVQPHGREWKHEFGRILARFIDAKVFPDNITQALLQSINNPAASSCGDSNLLRVLKQYDPVKKGMSLVEEVPENTLFLISGGRIFKRGKKMRTRFQCQEIATGKWYLFSGVYEVLVHIPEDK